MTPKKWFLSYISFLEGLYQGFLHYFEFSLFWIEAQKSIWLINFILNQLQRKIKVHW